MWTAPAPPCWLRPAEAGVHGTGIETGPGMMALAMSIIAGASRDGPIRRPPRYDRQLVPERSGNMRGQPATARRDMIGHRVAIRVIPAILGTKGNGHVGKQPGKPRPPRGLCRLHLLRGREMRRAIDRVRGQHIHARIK